MLDAQMDIDFSIRALRSCQPKRCHNDILSLGDRLLLPGGLTGTQAEAS